jgi:hypothetical protein
LSAIEKRFRVGMAVLVVLSVLAGLTLDGDLRILTWIVLGAFALKAWIAKVKKEKEEEGESYHQD